MHSAAAKAKDAMPYRGAGAQSEGKKVGQETGAKVDQAVCVSTAFPATCPTSAQQPSYCR